MPSSVESALFGTKIADLHVPVRPGGDVALANARAEAPHRAGRGRRTPSSTRTPTGWDELVAAPRRPARATTCSLRPGVTAGRARRLRRPVRRSVVVRSSSGRWASPSTATRSTACGRIVNLALARGNVGRDGAGLMPIRGHSGVQGGAEMGAYATALPGGVPVDARARRRARRAVGLRGAVARQGAPRPRCSRRPARRARRAVELGGQLPRGASRPDGGPGGARAGAAARPPGRHAVVADAGRRRRRDPAAGRHPLRAGGRRHRDHHRATHRLQPGDPAAGGGGPQRVAPVRRRGRPGAT